MGAPKKRTCRVSFRLDADHYDRLLRLRQEWNAINLTDAIEKCIAYTHWDLIARQEQVASAPPRSSKPKTSKKGGKHGQS